MFGNAGEGCNLQTPMQSLGSTAAAAILPLEEWPVRDDDGADDDGDDDDDDGDYDNNKDDDYAADYDWWRY